MLNRDELLATVRAEQPDAIFVVQLGNVSNALFALADSPSNWYLLGSMGAVIPAALGLSMSIPQRVIAIEGDGGLLMSLGCLSTVARYGGDNLGILILNNGAYESTGGQETAPCDLAAVAAGCGLTQARVFSGANSAKSVAGWLARPGPIVAIANTGSAPAEHRFISEAPSQIAGRIRNAIRPPVSG